MFGAVGVLLQVWKTYGLSCYHSADLAQATKGVSHLYDAIESLLQKVQEYLTRVSIYLKPAIPPSSALLDILVDTLVHIFTVLALVTKYCHTTAESDSKLKVLGSATRRVGMFKCLCRCHHNAYSIPKGDYFRVLVDKTGAQEVLDKLDALMQREQFVTAAGAYASIREVELVSTTVQPQIEFIRDETGRANHVSFVSRHLHLIICSSR